MSSVWEGVSRRDVSKPLAEIHERFTYRMHDLGQYLKTLRGRFTRWFNSSHERTGTLWEGRFRSVLVEEGVAARAIAAYIVDEIFNAYRERFGGLRKDGARAPRGAAASAKSVGGACGICGCGWNSCPD